MNAPNHFHFEGRRMHRPLPPPLRLWDPFSFDRPSLKKRSKGSLLPFSHKKNFAFYYSRGNVARIFFWAFLGGGERQVRETAKGHLKFLPCPLRDEGGGGGIEAPCIGEH